MNTGDSRIPDQANLGEVRPTNADQFNASTARVLPQTVAVREGIWSIAIPLKIDSPPYSLAYAIADTVGGIHLIDPGWDSVANWTRLIEALRQTGHSIDDIASVIVTHMHQDHLGMADRLRKATGARVAMHRDDQSALNLLSGAGNDAAGYSEWGVPSEIAAELHRLQVAEKPGQFSADDLLGDDQQLDIPGRQLRVIHTPGHTPGHISLWESAAGVLFTGDHLLPNLHPGVGLGGPAGNALSHYFNSLDRIQTLGDPEVAPGHGYGFRGLGPRIAATRAHQLRRSQEVAHILSVLPQASVWEVASRLTWTNGWERLPPHTLELALVQTSLRMRFVQS